MIKLKADCGAIEGQSADEAFEKALEGVATAQDDSILIDGHFDITGKHYKNFNNLPGRHLKIFGEGPTKSQLRPQMAPNEFAFYVGNLQSMEVTNFSIVGNPERTWDCGAVFIVTYTNELSWDKTHIYGLASDKGNGLGLIYLDSVGYSFTNSQFRGSTSNAAGLITLRQTRKGYMSNLQFIDYGEIGPVEPYYRSKNSYGFAESWIRFIEPQTKVNNAYLGTPLIESSTLDEGALNGISVDGGPGYMHGLRLRDVGINLRDNGLKLRRLENFTAEECRFTYREADTIDGTDVKRTKLIRCDAENAADAVFRGNCNSVVLEDSYGFDQIIVPAACKLITIRDGKII